MAESATSSPWLAPSGGRRFGAALLVAALIECGAIAALLVNVSHKHPTPAVRNAPIRISIEAPPQPLAPPMPKPVPPVPKPVVPPPPTPSPPPPPSMPALPIAPPLPPLRPASHPVRSVAPRPARHVKPAPVSPEVSQPPARTPPPPPAAAPQPPSGGEVSLFEAACRRAVQAALIYPAGAQAMRESGIVGLHLTYRNGAVSGVRVFRSSGFRILDQAAIATAQSARYPAPPPDFSGQNVGLDIAVVFQRAVTETDSD